MPPFLYDCCTKLYATTLRRFSTTAHIIPIDKSLSLSIPTLLNPILSYSIIMRSVNAEKCIKASGIPNYRFSLLHNCAMIIV